MFLSIAVIVFGFFSLVASADVEMVDCSKYEKEVNKGYLEMIADEVMRFPVFEQSVCEKGLSDSSSKLGAGLMAADLALNVDLESLIEDVRPMFAGLSMNGASSQDNDFAAWGGAAWKFLTIAGNYLSKIESADYYADLAERIHRLTGGEDFDVYLPPCFDDLKVT